MELVAVYVLCFLLASSVTGQQIEVTPREAVRRLGEDVRVVCKVAYPIGSCRMTVGSQSYILDPNNQAGDVVYSGEGLTYGECGAHIKNIKSEWNGNVTCVLPPQTGNIEIMGNMRLIIARPPEHPTLLTPDEPVFREGDSFTAQCKVPNGNPAARILWLLDDEPLLTGVHQPVTEHDPDSDLYTITQNVTRILQADDDLRRLACKVEHEALDVPIVAMRQLSVHYSPKRLENGPITIFGLKLGEEGRLNVTVRSSPPPRTSWSLGDRALDAADLDPNDNVQILQPQLLPQGSGYYNCTLLLRRVTKEDVERVYYLTVSNELGEEKFTIRMSTMDEPAGVELEAGAIAGIVIAILIVLIAISLVVFAKATDRWCFAGRSHRTDIPDGADSEAPLPPHDHEVAVKGSENPTHDHAEYITNGDTKHPEKKPDTAV